MNAKGGCPVKECFYDFQKMPIQQERFVLEFFNRLYVFSQKMCAKREMFVSRVTEVSRTFEALQLKLLPRGIKTTLTLLFLLEFTFPGGMEG